MKMDADEKELLDSVERGEWQSARGGKRERARYSRYARATFRKDRRLNIRQYGEHELAGLIRALIPVEGRIIVSELLLDLSEHHGRDPLARRTSIIASMIPRASPVFPLQRRHDAKSSCLETSARHALKNLGHRVDRLRGPTRFAVEASVTATTRIVSSTMRGHVCARSE